MGRGLSPRIGIFAGLRRRRWALCLAFGYALLLNALFSVVTANQSLAAAFDPLLSPSAFCGEAGNAAGSSLPATPQQHPSECPLCGPACPMAGCAPIDRTAAVAAISQPAPIDGIATGRLVSADLPRAARLYRSDVAAQAPPAA